jgi:hypothetical protein
MSNNSSSSQNRDEAFSLQRGSQKSIFGKSLLLSLTPYAMEQKLRQHCICLKESESDINKIKSLRPTITSICVKNKVFRSNEKLMKMALYSPYIIERALCLKDTYQFKQFIATGNGGAVIIITNNKGKEYVVKLMEYDIGFVYEVQSAYKFMNLGIGVNVYKACRVDFELNELPVQRDEDYKYVSTYESKTFSIGILVMEKVRYILDELYEENKSEFHYKQEISSLTTVIIPQILNVFKIMRENNCCHWDLHCGNIGFNDQYKLKIFDFGMSSATAYYPELTALSFAKGNMPFDHTRGLWKQMWEFLKDKIIELTGSENYKYDDDIVKRAKEGKLTYEDFVNQYFEIREDVKAIELQNRKEVYQQSCQENGADYCPDHTQEWINIEKRALSEIRHRHDPNLKRNIGTF